MKVEKGSDMASSEMEKLQNLQNPAAVLEDKDQIKLRVWKI